MLKLFLIALIIYIVVTQFRNQKSFKKPVQEFNIDPYQILGISSSSTEDEIRTAFKEQTKKNHPDLVTHMAPDFQKLAEEKLKTINWAYQEIRKTKGF